MKKGILLWFICGFAVTIHAQQQLHIHHINVENGDATLIGIYDEAQQKYTSKILIDGGQSSPDKLLLPYIQKMIGDDRESFHFEYVILTHYHDDHYKGLLALQDGRITTDSIIDPGGYTVSTIFTHSANRGIKPPRMKIALPWLSALKTAARHTPPFVLGRSEQMIRYGTTATTSLGNTIILGLIGTTPVTLECIAGWGNTRSSLTEITRNPKPEKENANNFTLAFILNFGEFRYFIGGDMGGKTTGAYIDQESSVSDYLDEKYPASTSWTGDTTISGHMCGFKANHHGSNFSNTSHFMERMHPTIIVTSAGNNKSWHLPNLQFLSRLSEVTPLSASNLLEGNPFIKGVYFTNLYNFPSGASKNTANALFQDKPGVSYDFGNASQTTKASYLIVVTNQEHTIETQSMFEVGKVDLTESQPYKRLATFTCHLK